MNFLEIIRFILKNTTESVEFLILCPIFAGFKKRRIDLHDFKAKRIFILQLNSIGDCLMTTPMLRALHEKFPEVSIDCAVRMHTKSLFENNPNVGNVFGFHDKFWRKFFTSPAYIRDFFKTLNFVRNNSYDMCIDLTGTFTSLLLVCLFKVKAVSGERKVVKAGIFRSNTSVIYDVVFEVKEKHISNQYLEIAGLLEHKYTSLKEELFLSGAEITSCDDFLWANKLTTRGYIVIHPGAKWPPKRWPPEYYAELIKLMFTKLNLRTIVVCGREDEKTAFYIKEKSGIKETGVAIGFSLKKLAVLIKKSSLFVGNDSGPAHIAAAVDVPSVVLFGPTDPGRCKPLSDKTLVLHDKISCWPCTLYYRRDRCERGKNVCLEGIKPEEVFNGAKKVMGK
ncbi:MAG: glycosyltransferase family 9 protein [Candidatus Omnitrophica bacterium]|nr:glycosyltransferase family 9 protein [Candidatus Omnitrophota bacterium]